MRNENESIQIKRAKKGVVFRRVVTVANKTLIGVCKKSQILKGGKQLRAYTHSSSKHSMRSLMNKLPKGRGWRNRSAQLVGGRTEKGGALAGRDDTQLRHVLKPIKTEKGLNKGNKKQEPEREKGTIKTQGTPTETASRTRKRPEKVQKKQLWALSSCGNR